MTREAKAAAFAFLHCAILLLQSENDAKKMKIHINSLLNAEGKVYNEIM